jgi:hypothetical protein
MKSFRTTNTGDEPLVVYDYGGSTRELQPGESFDKSFEEPGPAGQVDPLELPPPPPPPVPTQE